MKWISKNTILLYIILFNVSVSIAQITAGKILYERKTNLYKKFKDDNVRDWIKEEDKNKIDYFELYFNDSASLFRPQASELKETMSWTTNKNVVYQDFRKDYRLTVRKIWGEELFIEDTLYNRKWKITDSKRMISGYNCRKAIWQANDTTRIYAWYCDEIIPGVGPESFFGLPGAIMGVATEDGGVIYFAKNIEVTKPDIASIIPKKGKNKIYTPEELKTKLVKEFGRYPWGKVMIKNVFGIW